MKYVVIGSPAQVAAVDFRSKNPHAVALGRRGGKAGRGAAKARAQSPEQVAAFSRAGVLARQAKRRARLNQPKQT